MNQPNRNRQPGGIGCAQNMRPAAPADPCEKMNRAELMKHINEVSFAVSDILLYLDTHPQDEKALAYSEEMIRMRTHALKVYAKRFAPLTIDCVKEVNSNCWEWIAQPWPWEPTPKGGCR